ncbi:MAG TPA: hypothetical protein VGC53_14210 [Vicinamibacteria bacterium]
MKRKLIVLAFYWQSRCRYLPNPPLRMCAKRIGGAKLLVLSALPVEVSLALVRRQIERRVEQTVGLWNRSCSFFIR